MNLDKISEELQLGNEEEVAKLTKDALAAGVKPSAILQEGLVAGMDIIGEKFRNNEIFLPEVLIAAKAMKAGMEILRPILSRSNEKSSIKIILGTVEGDIHDIGKNLVGMLLEGGGFEVIDLGIDVPAERFVKEVKVEKPQVLGLSALLTTTMPAMKDVIETLTEAGVREDVKVIVGGAPVTENFAKTIGADGYAPDAAGAVVKVRELTQI